MLVVTETAARGSKGDIELGEGPRTRKLSHSHYERLGAWLTGRLTVLACIALASYFVNQVAYNLFGSTSTATVAARLWSMMCMCVAHGFHSS